MCVIVYLLVCSRVLSIVQNLCHVGLLLFLATALAWSVRPSNPIMNLMTFDLTFCMCMGHSHSCHGIEGQGQRSRSILTPNPSPNVQSPTLVHNPESYPNPNAVDPRSSIDDIFLVYPSVSQLKLLRCSSTNVQMYLATLEWYNELC